MKPSTGLLALVVLTASGALSAEKEEGWNPDSTFPPLPPAEAIKTIEIPKGSLAKSEWFRRGGDVDILGRILLKGQTGPIDGVTYGEGIMIPLEQTYTDEQLASVLNFIGQRWHNWKKPVAGADIARVRKDIADRKTPWTHEELKALDKSKPGK